MLKEVEQIVDAPFEKYWAHLECGHSLLCDPSVESENIIFGACHCPYCAMWDGIDIGDEVELRLTFCCAPTIAKFMGVCVGTRLRFIFAEGEDTFLPKEIVSVKKIY